MQYFNRLLLPVCLLLSGTTNLFSQSFTLKGNIKNAKGDTIELNYTNNYLTYDNTSMGKLKINEDGSFKLSNQLDKPHWCSLELGKRTAYLYISPGDELTVESDTAGFSRKMKFSGKGSEINEFLNKNYFTFEKSNRKLNKLQREVYYDTTGKMASSFYVFLDSTFDAKLKYADKYKDHPMIRFINYNRLNYRLNVRMTEFGENETPDFNVIEKEVNMWLAQYNLPLFNPEGLANSFYTSFLTTYYGTLQQKFMPQAEDPSDQQLDEYIKNCWTFLDGIDDYDIQCYLKAALINENLYSSNDQKRMKPYLELLMKNQPQNSYSLLAQKEFNENMKVSVGSMAPEFSYKGSDNKTYTMKDFFGKYVVLDVWATWCGPCRREIPHVLKLSQEFKDKNVQFISISVDPQEETWRKFLEKENMPWMQLWSPGNFKSDITKKYNVRGIPFFVM
ncbi:MAG: hypothetical protein A3H98_07725, partial [Bacteroidetes bacterium RIFCSPLOWO2_02_FULL_36_8]